MKSPIAAEAISAPDQAVSQPVASTRVAFLDNLRYLMVLLVVVYHSVAAYALIAPHWSVHDTNTLAADIIRELLDVFIMPVLFFAAGCFAIPSLERKGLGDFLRDKVERLLLPWALAVLIVLPLALYDQPVKPVRPFWRYWLTYLGSFQTRLRFSQVPVGITTQAIYWFLSLLFVFFLLYGVVYALLRRWRSRAALMVVSRTISTSSVLAALLSFGILTSVAYFLLLMVIPDSSWFTLSVFLEFQVTRLVPYAGCFALGVYTQSRDWFAGGKPLGSLVLWGVASALLGAAYIAFGQPMFADTAGTVRQTIPYLLVFAVLRSFLLLTLLVTLVWFGVRFWNSARALDRRLAAASYNIYLVHFFIVVMLQAALLNWIGGPVAAKIAIVCMVTLGLSYAISRWVLEHHSRAFALAVLGLFVLCLLIRP